MGSDNGRIGSFGPADPDADIRLSHEEPVGALGHGEDPPAQPAARARGGPGKRAAGQRPAPSPSSPPNAVEQLADRARAKGVTPPFDPDTETAAPFFWDLVTRSVNGDGSERLLPDIRITREPGGWVCVVQDVETSQETRFAFQGLLDLARAAERHMTSPDCVWKKYKNRKNPKGLDRHSKKNA